MSIDESDRAKSRVRVVAGLAAVLILTLCACEALPASCEVDIAANAMLTEERAISVARQALEKVGLGHKNYEQVPFTNDPSAPERYFARNSYNPESGYVRWHRIGAEPHEGVSVHLERRGALVMCQVSKWK